jgi:hypothetical protein
MCKGLKKQLAVGVIEKDLLAGIPPTGHMINRTSKRALPLQILRLLYRRMLPRDVLRNLSVVAVA